MSILIEGMEMPTSCYKCPLRRRDGMDIVCPVAHERFSVADVNILDYRLDNCPFVPVPPHGRLIDADALMLQIQEYIEEYGETDEHGWHSEKWCAMKEAAMAIESAPTIIETEEGET